MKKNIMTLLSFLILTTGLIAQSGPLYEKGYSAYTKKDWKNAVIYLGAYINSNPADFTNKIFKDQVIGAFNYARSEYLRSLAPKSGFTSNDDGLGSSVAGLSILPPDLPRPKVAMMLSNLDFNRVDGSWLFTIRSSTGTTTPCTLEVSQSGKIVSGTLRNPAGKQMQVVGTFDTGVLALLCITGEETTQMYILRRTDPKNFSGTFRNEGRWADNGNVSMSVSNL